MLPCFFGIWEYPPWINKEVMTEADVRLQTVWYVTLPAMFNLGWASVQVAHMSIVNQLSQSNRRRDQLANARNGLTSAAFIIVLLTALLVFVTVDDAIL